jgi:hypothetical protein
MTREDIEVLSLRMAEKLKAWLDVEAPTTHFILIMLDRLEDGALATALTGTNPSAEANAHVIHDLGEAMLSHDPSVEIQHVQVENDIH